MLANEMNKLANVSRNTDDEFNKQWVKMKDRIKEYASNGKNECIMVYGEYNEQLIEKLKENGFRVGRNYEIHSNVCYGMRNCNTYYVVW